MSCNAERDPRALPFPQYGLKNALIGEIYPKLPWERIQIKAAKSLLKIS